MILRRLGWLALAIVTVAFAAGPDLAPAPAPQDARLLDRAVLSPDDGPGGPVSLPHAVASRPGGRGDLLHYRIAFDLPARPGENLFVFLPAANRRIALALGDEPFLGLEASPFWSGPLVSAPVLARLPRASLAVGRNVLTVTVETGGFAAPTYLSAVWLGSEEALAGPYKWQNFLAVESKTMALAGHLVLGLGLIFAFFVRPREPIFAWLAALNLVSLTVAIGVSVGYQPALRPILPFIGALVPAMGLLFLGLTLVMVGRRPPRLLPAAIVVAPCALLPLAVVDLDGVIALRTLATVGVGTLLACYLAATGLLVRSALRGDFDARLILAPVFLIAWFSVRDVYVVATAPDHGFNLLVSYGRPLLMAFVTAMLMRRMAVGLDQLDRANETLNMRLAAREAELASLHRQDQERTARLTRARERQRLTHDLHDGLSGQLMSIIALSERSGEARTERAARDALNDLRLVIHSLDLDDRELPLALASLRERIIQQFAGLDIELDWSTAGLPEVSGVTPSNALAILRILQEAVTNAVKHGPARRITVRGAPAPGGMVALTVENDGAPFAGDGKGHGIGNMRRRAEQLHGLLTVTPLAAGTLVTLVLPRMLPSLTDEADPAREAPAHDATAHDATAHDAG